MLCTVWWLYRSRRWWLNETVHRLFARPFSDFRAIVRILPQKFISSPSLRLRPRLLSVHWYSYMSLHEFIFTYYKSVPTNTCWNNEVQVRKKRWIIHKCDSYTHRQAPRHLLCLSRDIISIRVLNRDVMHGWLFIISFAYLFGKV